MASEQSPRAALAQANTALALKFLRHAFAEADLAAAERCLGEDFQHHQPGFAPGKRGMVDFLRGILASAPPVALQPVRTLADGDFVLVHGRRTTGTNMTATIDIFRLRDEAIVEHWHVFQVVPPATVNANGMF